METLFTSQYLRGIARTLAIAELLLWGAFFVEHLGWFSDPANASPPATVWLRQLAHLTLLVGYLVIWKWERQGAIIILIGALTFFPLIGGPHAWWYTLFAVSPAIVLFFAWRKKSV
ncbi:MAG: hypothetical protein K9I85_14340 [Saprospiraceae bacterium]|nr:hypothetical protein [Saprospiraceae bacterium]